MQRLVGDLHKVHAKLLRWEREDLLRHAAEAQKKRSGGGGEADSGGYGTRELVGRVAGRMGLALKELGRSLAKVVDLRLSGGTQLTVLRDRVDIHRALVRQVVEHCSAIKRKRMTGRERVADR